MAGEGSAGLGFGAQEGARWGVAAVVHGQKDAAEVARQVEAGEVGAALGVGGGRVAGARAVEVEEEDAPAVRGGGVAPEGDVLIAEVAVDEAGVVEGAHGGRDGFEKVHEGRAEGGLGVDALEFGAEVGEAGFVRGHEAAFEEAAGARVAAFEGRQGRGGADGGVLQAAGVQEGAHGLARDAETAGGGVAPGGDGAVGFDDEVVRAAAGQVVGGEDDAVEAVASGGTEEGAVCGEEVAEARCQRAPGVGGGVRGEPQGPAAGSVEPLVGGVGHLGGWASAARRCCSISMSLAYLRKTPKAEM